MSNEPGTIDVKAVWMLMGDTLAITLHDGAVFCFNGNDFYEHGNKISHHAAISITISWLEGEIMGIEGYQSHSIGKTKKGWLVEVYGKGWADYGDVEPTKLTALIECHKELKK